MSGWQGAQELHAEGGHAVAYKGMVDCFVRTVREEGTKALFKVGPVEILYTSSPLFADFTIALCIQP